MHDCVLAIHGGAGAAPRDHEAARANLRAALAAGWAQLIAGRPATVAAEAAVRALEDGGVFNAGRGGAADAQGRVLCDAALMDGATRGAGAVAAVAGLRAPISCARAVAERSRHVLLVGADAAAQARAWGAEVAAAGWFLRATAVGPHGTVGAVARDRAGALAAATSTGGTSAKLPGRVGDSPLIGAGTWADERVAVSATGTGEYFIRAAFAHRIAAAVAAGRSVADAAAEAMAAVAAFGGDGGAIVLGNDGDLAFPLNTPAMARGWVDARGRARVAITSSDPDSDPG
ncbi:MAG TPA: isoaspartyl peptidase/L-asparaginase [Planctomycetota bacterium]|nr:isoaspartyl peptidase/L-asparaginase [Planctomycetota bacterium]